MIETIIETLKVFTVGTIGQLGYFGIALLMAIESACIPLPSEIIMPFAGYLVSIGQMNIWLAALAGAIGCNVGSEVAYWIGYVGGRAAIYKYGKYVLLSPHELEIAEKWFDRQGDKTVFIARLLPVVRTFIAFPAGVAKMKRLRFHIYTFVGSYPWCLMLAWVGYKMGKAWDDKNSAFRKGLHEADLVIVALLVIGAIWFVRSRVKAFKKMRQKSNSNA
jgi:membrane protein DedA with SNARE-associated domain